MKRWKKLTLGVSGTLIAALAVFLIPTIWGKPWSIEHFYYRVFLQFALEHPQMLSSMRVLEPMGLDFHNDDLDDYSPAGIARDMQMARESLQMLQRYDRDKVNDALSYAVLEFFLTDSADGEEFALYGYPVNQMSGFQSNLPDFMVNTHQIDGEKAARNYVARLSRFGAAFDQMLQTLDKQESMGIVPPRFVMTHVLKEMRDFIAVPAAEHLLHEHFTEAIAQLDGLSDERREELSRQVIEQIERVVYPAYERMIAHYAALEPDASTDAGVWKLPAGDRYYAYMLRRYTTTDLQAEEIHAIGLAEVERLQREMRDILHDEGYAADDLTATMQALGEEERFLYPDTDAGRERVLADYQAIIDEIDGAMDAFFGKGPAATVEVQRVPEFKEATSPAAYYRGPAFDGSRPGVFYANLRDLSEIPKFGMRTLAYHEGVPGHHLQTALAQEMQGMPFFRRVISFTAFSEGWALYAEQVAAENGFQDDPYDRLGYLAGQLFRACRLVVDTGIHHKRWPRQQSIDYLSACSGTPVAETVAEVERYIVLPGQACAYMIGKMEILRLREQAQSALGPRFDVREFHDVVLRNGDLPLVLLRREVERWLAEAGSG